MEITQTAVVVFCVLLTLIGAKLHKSLSKKIGFGNFIYAIVAGKDQWENGFTPKQKRHIY